MPSTSTLGIAGVESLPSYRSGMQLSECVMERLAEAERLVEGRIETVERAHLELIRTLEVVADVRNESFTSAIEVLARGSARMRVRRTSASYA